MNLKQHPEHKDIFVSEDGRVFRELTPSLDSGGYHQIRNGRFRRRRHVLVAETWVGPKPFDGAVVRHKDDNPANDVPSNLVWGTQAQNVQDAKDNGLFPMGGNAVWAKLTEEQAKEIKMRRKAGESGRALSEEFGITEASVCDIHKGRTWGWL
jgi:hypothetical protein